MESITRRQFIGTTAGLAGVITLPAWAQQQLFDNMHMFIPAGPGGGWDSTGRAIEKAAKAAGLVGNMQFENVGGAGGMVGLPRFVEQRAGQGNSLMVGGSVMVGAGIANKSPVTINNVIPIARLTEEAGVIVVPSQGSIKTFKDFAKAIKENPKAVSVGGGSAGGTDHILLGLVIKALGGNPKDAAYVAFAGGGPANAAILGGQVVAGISGYSEFEEHIKSGKMIALAVSGNKRIPNVNVPTLVEQGIQVTAANWRGVFAPPRLSAEQRSSLENFMTKVHESAGWQQELEKHKWTDVFLTGKAFEDEVKASIADTTDVLKSLGLA